MPRNCSPPDSPQGPGGVIFCPRYAAEPDIKHAVSFIDGQLAEIVNLRVLGELVK